MDRKNNYFKTKELADLFDTSIDTLRYYEKIGLLHPIRDTSNNYRYFTSNDVETLALVMELLKLHFSLAEIKELVNARTVKNTLTLLQKEDVYLQEQIAELRKTQKSIRSRIRFMNRILYETPLAEIQLRYFPTRNCIKNSDENIDEDLFHVAVSKYHNYQLPAGYYLTLAFPSAQGQADDNTYPTIQQFIDFIEEYQIAPRSNIYSFFMIDEPESSLEEEYIIELQLQIDDTDLNKLSGILPIPER